MNEHSVNSKSAVRLRRTHLQDAVPVTLGQEFSDYAAMIDIQMLEAALPLGATAVGTGLSVQGAWRRPYLMRSGI